jgi:hypothetical protein
MAQVFSRRPLTEETRVRSRDSPCGIMVDKVALRRVFPQVPRFPLSISFHRCSITRKNEKKLIIIITGLHNKPQGCGASVASAAGPFTKIIIIISSRIIAWREDCWMWLWIYNVFYLFMGYLAVEAMERSPMDVASHSLGTWCILIRLSLAHRESTRRAVPSRLPRHRLAK